MWGCSGGVRGAESGGGRRACSTTPWGLRRVAVMGGDGDVEVRSLGAGDLRVERVRLGGVWGGGDGGAEVVGGGRWCGEGARVCADGGGEKSLCWVLEERPVTVGDDEAVADVGCLERGGFARWRWWICREGLPLVLRTRSLLSTRFLVPTWSIRVPAD